MVTETERAKRPRLAQHPTIEVNSDNCIWGSVNGQRCQLLLDSGCDMPVIFLPLALKLGLVNGEEQRYSSSCETWEGKKDIELLYLREVVILLEGDVEVHTPASVFPESLGSGYNMEQIVLDVCTLRRGDMLQKFHRGGSSLVIRRPDLLRTLPAPSERRRELFTFVVRQVGAGAEFRVMLDTGCLNFGLSDNWKRTNLPPGVDKVRNVYLEFGDGCCLHARHPATLRSNTQGIIIGCKPLRRYKAVVDYG